MDYQYIMDLKSKMIEDPIFYFRVKNQILMTKISFLFPLVFSQEYRNYPPFKKNKRKYFF